MAQETQHISTHIDTHTHRYTERHICTHAQRQTHIHTLSLPVTFAQRAPGTHAQAWTGPKVPYAHRHTDMGRLRQGAQHRRPHCHSVEVAPDTWELG